MEVNVSIILKLVLDKLGMKMETVLNCLRSGYDNSICRRVNAATGFSGNFSL